MPYIPAHHHIALMKLSYDLRNLSKLNVLENYLCYGDKLICEFIEIFDTICVTLKSYHIRPLFTNSITEELNLKKLIIKVQSVKKDWLVINLILKDWSELLNGVSVI